MDEWSDSFSDLDQVVGKIITGTFVCTGAQSKVIGSNHSILFCFEADTNDNEKSLKSYDNKVFLYCNCKIGEKGNIRVEKNSKFARLYRLTFGVNPRARFSKSQQLMKHFIGHVFNCECELYQSNKLKIYWKVKSIRPETPIFEGMPWTEYGALQQARKKKTKVRKNINETKESVSIFPGEDSISRDPDESEDEFFERVFEETISFK